MPTLFLILALIWISLLLGASVWATLRAQTPMSRLLALDTMAIILIALLSLIAHVEERPYMLDSALMLALLAFVGTLAAARFYSEGRPF
ncbi:MAG: pH regulation protein F [Oscillochloris sp.]|nr:pH regulation protein F [Oscillochloris sp.]